MTLQKIEFEYDIPDGYRFVRYGVPKKGEACLANGKIIIAQCDFMAEFPIVEKISDEKQPEINTKRHKHADLIHAWADGEEIQYWNRYDKWDNIDTPSWDKENKYRIKPKNKTVRFRNWMGKDGVAYCCVNTNPENSEYFKQWLGDWQEVEVKE